MQAGLTKSRCRWRHAQEIEHETFNDVVKYHCYSLVSLVLNDHFRAYPSKPSPPLRTLAVQALEGVAITHRRIGPLKLLVESRDTLESLTIGFEKEALQAYEEGPSGMAAYIGSGLVLTSLAAIEYLADELEIKRKAGKSSKLRTLVTLRLCSFDLGGLLLKGPMGSFLDLSKLKMLVIESCVGLVEAFEALTASPNRYQFRPSQLRSLTVRTEYTEDLDIIESFVCSLSGLTDLCLLVEENFHEWELETFSVENIAQSHGETLKTLVLESRVDSRVSSNYGTSAASYDNLCDICHCCPNLVELGITLEWESIVSDGHKQSQV